MDAMTYHLFGLLGFALSLFTLAISVVAIIKVADLAIQTKQSESRWASEVARLDEEVDRQHDSSIATIGAVNALINRANDLEAAVSRLAPAPAVCCRSDASKTAKTDK